MPQVFLNWSVGLKGQAFLGILGTAEDGLRDAALSASLFARNGPRRGSTPTRPGQKRFSGAPRTLPAF